MTTGNPLTEPPHTPFPDAMGSSDSETSPSASRPPAVDPSRNVPESTTGDDINLMLATSIEKPEPDPILGSADPLDLDIGIRLTPSPDAAARNRAGETTGDELDRIAGDASKPSYSWSTLLLASYSSAVTMALIWVLWTNRGLSRPDTAVAPPPAIDWGRLADKPPAIDSSLPEDHVTTLGKPVVVGDLEVTPLVVLFQGVGLFRLVDLEGEERREVPDCLVLTLRLTNRSSDRRLRPLDLASVREVGESGGSFIESATGERISMFELALESEWSIEHQTFPTVEPGRSEDVILVSEPIPDRRVAGPLVWRITLQTDAGEFQEIGVRFDRHEIGESEF